MRACGITLCALPPFSGGCDPVGSVDLDGVVCLSVYTLLELHVVCVDLAGVISLRGTYWCYLLFVRTLLELLVVYADIPGDVCCLC